MRKYCHILILLVFTFVTVFIYVDVIRICKIILCGHPEIVYICKKSTMKERLAKFIKNEELSPSRFAEIMGVPPSSISHLLSGRNNPGFDFLSKMLMRFPKVNPDWLILGTGPMYRTTGMASVVVPPSSQSPGTTTETSESHSMQQPVELPASASANIPGPSFANEVPSLFADEATQLIPEQPAEPIQQEPDHIVAEQKKAAIGPEGPTLGVVQSNARTTVTPQAMQGQTDVYKQVAKPNEREIDRIIIFFGDGTFRSYVNSHDGL
jgi:hypothetical protein